MERDKKPPYIYLFMIILATLGVMEVIFLLTYLKPSDGGIWRETPNGLEVQSVVREIETHLQVGDLLVQIDDQPVESLQDYEEILFHSQIKSKHLYSIIRDGIPFEPWITISGIREKPEAYFVFSLAGFVFLFFSFLLVGQAVPRLEKNRIILLSLCTYLTFVFYRTDLLTPLDWLSFFLNLLGSSFLASCFFESLIAPLTKKSNTIQKLNMLHWIVSILFFLTLIFYLTGAHRLEIMKDLSLTKIQLYQQFWTITLFLLTVAIALSSKEIKTYWGSIIWIWVFAFTPYLIFNLKLTYPFDAYLASTLAMALPMAIFIDWNRTYKMFISGAGRQVAIYSTILLTLFTSFFLFLGLFYQLLAGKVSPETQLVLSSFSVIMAAVAFNPLKRVSENFWNRIVYGTRLSALKNLLDMSSINRADTSMTAFFSTIHRKVQDGFGLRKVRSYLFDKQKKVFMDIDRSRPAIRKEQISFSRTQGFMLSPEQCGLKNEKGFLPEDLILPIYVDEAPVGFLHLSNESESIELSQEEQQLLINLVNQSEVLLENIELYQDANEKAKRIENLREFNESIIESSRVGLVSVDDMGLIVSCNRAFRDIINYSENPEGLRFGYLLQEHVLERSYLGKKGQIIEGYFKNPQGESFQLELQQTPLKSKDNRVFGTLYLVEDIHDRKKMQEKMMQQEKLASIGLLAAGVAHEINTPLTGIQSYSQFLIEDQEPGELRDLVEKILSQSKRASSIVRGLLNFTRKTPSPFVDIDLRQLVSQSFTLISHSLKKNQVSHHIECDHQDYFIQGNANQLQQVFINIMVNAIDAMEEGGTLTVTLTKTSNHVALKFIDNGAGIKEEDMPRIFDPFFTTKEIGKGTGLGLSIAYNICQDHNAELSVESKTGEGSCVTIKFPLS